MVILGLVIFHFGFLFFSKLFFGLASEQSSWCMRNVEICMMNVDCRASASHQWLLKSATRSAGFMLFPLRGMAIIVIVWRTQRRPGGSGFLALWFGCDVDLTVLCFFFFDRNRTYTEASAAVRSSTPLLASENGQTRGTQDANDHANHVLWQEEDETRVLV